MELLLPSHRDFSWEGQKEDLDKNIQEKTGELDMVEDVHDEKDTANTMCVVDFGIPGIGPRGFTGSINGAQLNWYGTHKSLLVVDHLLLHAYVRKVGKIMQLLMERNPIPGPHRIVVQ